MKTNLPRIMVAGLGGDSGKSLFSLGLIMTLKEMGKRVAPFKKGPDFIDSAWLGKAAGLPGRNLDTFLMDKDVILNSLANSKNYSDIAVIEGNRGLFDGLDHLGTHSSASLSKITDTPVILVIDVTKTTATIAALVLGCIKMDPDLNICGVVLNRTGTLRQEKIIRKAIELKTGVKVLGTVPRLKKQYLPNRHLGLVTACEHPQALEALYNAKKAVRDNVDIDAIINISENNASQIFPGSKKIKPIKKKQKSVRIGVLKDKAFSFYYPENLSMLESYGAKLSYFSPLEDKELPGVDALYAGGGFPEIYASDLACNVSLKKDIKDKVDEGMPVWAECGGLMYLCDQLLHDGAKYPMTGAIPVKVEQRKKPQGHGYVSGTVDAKNPFFSNGTKLKGHEFHYSKITSNMENVPTVIKLEKGSGTGNSRDGICHKNVVASYTHLHALGVPDWAPNFVAAAAKGVQI